MAILVDSSVWIEHFRKGLPSLKKLLLDGDMSCHPFIIGELACGNLKNRGEIIDLLLELPSSELLPDQEVLHFIESRRLFGKGIGWVDAHLLASTLVTGSFLWTLDKSLNRLADSLNIAYTPLSRIHGILKDRPSTQKEIADLKKLWNR